MCRLLRWLTNPDLVMAVLAAACLAAAFYAGTAWGYRDGVKAGWSAKNTSEFRALTK